MYSRPITLGVAALAATSCVLGATPADARDRPFSTSRMTVRPVVDPLDTGTSSGGSGQYSTVQIERYRCNVSAGAEYGSPAGAMDISCNDPQPYRQDFNPDNELAVVANPKVPAHLLGGSNDYFYRFNNSTGARQAIVPTGFFTSFDAGASWVDGQVPMQTGNGAGDPSPAFDGKLSGDTPQTGWAMMAQLENVGGQSGPYVSQGNVSVSWSSDGGITWGEPTVAMKGKGAGIGPAANALFFDKEWLTVDNYPDSPHYGRAYLVAARYLIDVGGAYDESPVYLAYSDDGGRTWSKPKEISGSNPLCTFQSPGPTGECDEDSFPITEVAPNGDIVVHFATGNVESGVGDAGRVRADIARRQVHQRRNDVQQPDGRLPTSRTVPRTPRGASSGGRPSPVTRSVGSRPGRSRPTRRIPTTGSSSTTTTSRAPTTRHRQAAWTTSQVRPRTTTHATR